MMTEFLVFVFFLFALVGAIATANLFSENSKLRSRIDKLSKENLYLKEDNEILNYKVNFKVPEDDSVIVKFERD